MGTTRFYLTVYGYQTRPNFLRTAHTFAEVAKTEFAEDGTWTDVSSTLISWLPAAGTIHLIGAEPGRNYTMEETLEWADRVGADIRATPPTEVTEAFYGSFLERRAELDSGSVLYIMNDHFADRPDRETNCIHAVSDLPVALAALPMLDTGIWHGYLSSNAVYNYLRPWFVESEPEDALEDFTVLQTETLERDSEIVVQHLEEEEAIRHLVRAMRFFGRGDW